MLAGKIKLLTTQPQTRPMIAQNRISAWHTWDRYAFAFRRICEALLACQRSATISMSSNDVTVGTQP
jgi:hypothetical protein